MSWVEDGGVDPLGGSESFADPVEASVSTTKKRRRKRSGLKSKRGAATLRDSSSSEDEIASSSGFQSSLHTSSMLFDDSDSRRRSNRIARPAYRPEDDTAVSNDYLDEFLGNQGLNSTNDDLGGQESDNDSDFDPDSSNAKGHSTPKKKVKPNSAQVPPPPPPSLATTVNPKTRKVQSVTVDPAVLQNGVPVTPRPGGPGLQASSRGGPRPRGASNTQPRGRIKHNMSPSWGRTQIRQQQGAQLPGMPMPRPTRPPVRGSSVVAGNSTRGSIRGFKRPLKGQVGLTREDVSQRNLITARGAPMRGQVRPQNINVAQRAKAPTVRSTTPGVSPHARRVPADGTTTGQSAIQGNSTNDMWSSLVTVDTLDRFTHDEGLLYVDQSPGGELTTPQILDFLVKAGRGQIPTRDQPIQDIHELYPQQQADGDKSRVVYVFKKSKDESDGSKGWWDDGETWARLNNIDQIRIMESGEFVNVSREKASKDESRIIHREATWTTMDPDLVVVRYDFTECSYENSFIPNYDELAGLNDPADEEVIDLSSSDSDEPKGITPTKVTKSVADVLPPKTPPKIRVPLVKPPAPTNDPKGIYQSYLANAIPPAPGRSSTMASNESNPSVLAPTNKPPPLEPKTKESRPSVMLNLPSCISVQRFPINSSTEEGGREKDQEKAETSRSSESKGPSLSLPQNSATSSRETAVATEPPERDPDIVEVIDDEDEDDNKRKSDAKKSNPEEISKNIDTVEGSKDLDTSEYNNDNGSTTIEKEATSQDSQSPTAIVSVSKEPSQILSPISTKSWAETEAVRNPSVNGIDIVELIDDDDENYSNNDVTKAVPDIPPKNMDVTKGSNGLESSEGTTNGEADSSQSLPVIASVCSMSAVLSDSIPENISQAVTMETGLQFESEGPQFVTPNPPPPTQSDAVLPMDTTEPPDGLVVYDEESTPVKSGPSALVESQEPPPLPEVVELLSSDEEQTPSKATNIESLTLVTPDKATSTPGEGSKKKKIKKKFTPVRPKGDFPLRQNQYKQALNFDAVATPKNPDEKVDGTANERCKVDSSNSSTTKEDKDSGDSCKNKDLKESIGPGTAEGKSPEVEKQKEGKASVESSDDGVERLMERPPQFQTVASKSPKMERLSAEPCPNDVPTPTSFMHDGNPYYPELDQQAPVQPFVEKTPPPPQEAPEDTCSGSIPVLNGSISKQERKEAQRIERQQPVVRMKRIDCKKKRSSKRLQETSSSSSEDSSSGDERQASDLDDKSKTEQTSCKLELTASQVKFMLEDSD